MALPQWCGVLLCRSRLAWDGEDLDFLTVSYISHTLLEYIPYIRHARMYFFTHISMKNGYQNNPKTVKTTVEKDVYIPEDDTVRTVREEYTHETRVDDDLPRRTEYHVDDNHCGDTCRTWIIVGVIATLALMALAYMMGKQAGYDRAHLEVARQIPSSRQDVVVPRADGVVDPRMDRR